MTSLITGATGLIGRALVERLGTANVLSRDPDRARRQLGQGINAFPWLPMDGPPPAEAFEGVTAVYHLAGEPLGDGRWTATKKRRIKESRTIGTRHLIEGMAACEVPPTVLVSSSGIGYYGSQGGRVLTESSPLGRGFLAEICRDWEAEALKATPSGVRVVTVRTGLVLATQSGALAKMLPIMKAGLGGKLGDGTQFMSWIHLQDMVELLCFAAETPALSGPLNAVAPNPVTNTEFTRTLARCLGRWAILPAPAFGIRLLLGEMGGLALESQNVQPGVALAHGFKFAYSDLEAALRATLA